MTYGFVLIFPQNNLNIKDFFKSQITIKYKIDVIPSKILSSIIFATVDFTLMLHTN